MSKKILIVDHNALMLEVMTYILTSNGYDVIPLSHGNEVFSHVKTDHPDLVIVDALLPGIDGVEICQLLKMNKATENLPVIICSVEDDIDESLDIKGAPDDILYKPFDIHSLIKMVEYRLAA